MIMPLAPMASYEKCIPDGNRICFGVMIAVAGAADHFIGLTVPYQECAARSHGAGKIIFKIRPLPPVSVRVLLPDERVRCCPEQFFKVCFPQRRCCYQFVFKKGLKINGCMLHDLYDCSERMDTKLMKLKIAWLVSRKTVVRKQLPADVKDLLIECLNNEYNPACRTFSCNACFMVNKNYKS